MGTNGQSASLSANRQMRSLLFLPRGMVISFCMLVVWAMLFALYNPLNPAGVGQEGLTEIVEQTQNGDLLHQIIVLLLGTIGAIFLLRYRIHFRSRSATVYLLIGYVAWLFISILWSDDRFLSLRRELSLLLMGLFALWAVAYIETRRLLLCVAGLCALNLCAALAQELIRDGFGFLAPGQRFGGTITPNIQGASAAISALIMGVYACHSSGRRRTFGIVAAASFVVFLILTGSRTAAIALFGAACFCGALIAIRKTRLDARVMAGGLFLIIVAIFASTALHMDRGHTSSSSITTLLRTDRDAGEVEDLTGRTMIWSACLPYAEARPILGYGYGAFWTREHYDEVAHELHWPTPHAHCAYLDVTLQLGLTGALLYCALLFSALSAYTGDYVRINDYASCAWAGVFVFFLINGLTESLLVVPNFPALILIAGLMKRSLSGNTLNRTVHF